MYMLARERKDTYKVLALGIALIYVAITWATPFLHSDDCPLARGGGATGDPLSSSTPCPACKFLAGSNATQVHYDPCPDVQPPKIPTESVADSVIVVADLRTGSILLRAPPMASLS